MRFKVPETEKMVPYWHFEISAVLLNTLFEENKDASFPADIPLKVMSREDITFQEIRSTSPFEQQWIFVEEPSYWSIYLPHDWSPAAPLMEDLLNDSYNREDQIKTALKLG